MVSFLHFEGSGEGGVNKWSNRPFIQLEPHLQNLIL
jgi:hypothetical protein